MSFLQRLFAGKPKLDGAQLAQSGELKEYAQIDLLGSFMQPRKLHDPGDQQRWSRALPQPYAATIRLFEQLGWLDVNTLGEYTVTPVARPFVEAYHARMEQAKQEAMRQVRRALEAKETSEALTIRRVYEARFPLGKAPWTGPEPQLSHSALTRRIFFLDHWLLAGLSKPTTDWLKLYAAEQHLWGAHWRLPATEIPDYVLAELARPELDGPDAVYWKAYQLALYVDNQETWQRCKGGDHVRRLAIVGPDDEYTCDHCRSLLSKEFLVTRVPELPPRACTSPIGCRCRYEPVLEMLDDIEA